MLICFGRVDVATAIVAESIVSGVSSLRARVHGGLQPDKAAISLRMPDGQLPPTPSRTGHRATDSQVAAAQYLGAPRPAVGPGAASRGGRSAA